MNKQTGFTLIELLVVVLIIGILAAVALPQYEKAVFKAKATNALTFFNALQKAETVYYLSNGEYTNDFESLDLQLPEQDFHKAWGVRCDASGCSLKMEEKLFLFWADNGRPCKTVCNARPGDSAGNSFCNGFGALFATGSEGVQGNWNRYCMDK